MLTHYFGLPYIIRQKIARIINYEGSAVPEYDWMHLFHVIVMTSLGVAIGYFLAKAK